jgi:hypothetical protein
LLKPEVLAGMVDSNKLRMVALACLDGLADDNASREAT